MVQVLYADKDILVAVKPAGVESTGGEAVCAGYGQRDPEISGYPQVMHAGKGALCGSYSTDWISLCQG